MRKLALLLLLLAAPASAANYYVTSNATMATANAGVTAGSIVVVANGSYTTVPSPVTDGSSGSPIIYRGGSGVTYSGSLSISKDYVRYVGGNVTGDLSFTSAAAHTRCDSLTVSGSLLTAAWQYCSVNYSNIAGGYAMQGDATGIYPSMTISAYAHHDTLLWVNGTVTRTGANSANGGSIGINWTRFAHSLYFSHVHFDITVNCSGATQDFQVSEFYWTRNSEWKDCYMKVTNNAGDHPGGCSSSNVKISYGMRDSAMFNVSERCTVWTAPGTAPSSRNMLANSGSLSNQYYNTFINCIFWNDTDAGAEWYGGNKANWLHGNLFGSTDGPAFSDNGGIGDSSIIRHNTFVSSQRRALTMSDASTSGVKFAQNILYGRGPLTTPCGGTGSVMAQMEQAAFGDSNLYYNSAQPADSGSAIARSSGTCNAPIAYKSTYRWKSPLFQDSTVAFGTFNGALRAGSWGLGATFASSPWPDGYAGAYGVATGDVTAPSAVTDLAILSTTSGSLELEWGSQGDDAGVGTATAYDVRYSTSVIDASNFAAATQATGEPTPAISGSTETFTITGLAVSTTYYVALKVLDEVGNTSALSNVVTDATTAASGTNPITVGTLQAYANYTTAGLQLAFSGDDNRNATARMYMATVDSSGYADTCGSVASFCGSLFGLRPATTYTAYMDVADADGGGATVSVTFTTKTYPTLEPTAYIYADPASGSDSNPGTAASPKQTIQAAWDLAGEGEGVFLNAGVYYDTLVINTSNDGGAGQRKWLQGATGAILDGSDINFITKSTYDSLTISGSKVYFIRGFTYWPRQVTYNNQYDLPKHVTLKSLVNDSTGAASGYGWFKSNTGDTVYIQLPGGASPNGATMNYARRNYLLYSTGSYLGLKGVTFRNAGCDFNTNFAGNSGIRTGVVQFLGANDLVVDGCTFYSNGWDHLSVDSTSGTPTRDVLITGNTMYSQGVYGWGSGSANHVNASPGHHPQIFVDASRGVVIERNTFHDFFDAAVRTDQRDQGSLRDMDIIGNTIYNFQSEGIELDAINGPNIRVLSNTLHQGYQGFDLEIHGGPVYFIGNRTSRIEYAAIQTRGAVAADTLDYTGRQFWFHNTLLCDQWVLRSVGPATRGMWFENNIFGSKTERTIYDANNAYYDYPENQFNWNLHLPSSNLLTVKVTTYGLADTTTMRTARTMEKNGRFSAASAFAFVDSANGNFRPLNLNAIGRGRGLPGINKATQFRAASGGGPDIGALESFTPGRGTSPVAGSSSISGGAFSRRRRDL